VANIQSGQPQLRQRVLKLFNRASWIDLWGVPQFREFDKLGVGDTPCAVLDGWGSAETNFVLGTTIEHQKPGLMGPVFEGFQARVVDGQDNARRYREDVGSRGRKKAVAT
jgi:hypothetical protein